MARFRATIQGNRGEASRLGSASSGIRSKVNGWNVGIEVWGEASGEDRDAFTVAITGGSNKAIPNTSTLHIQETESGEVSVTVWCGDRSRTFTIPREGGKE